MSLSKFRESITASRSKAVSAVTIQHGIAFSLADGAESSNDFTTQGDITFRRSKRFKSKVLPYWNFERIACISTSDGNKTVIARDVPGEGTIIVQELQLSGTVESSVNVEPSQIELENLAKNKSSKKKASQDKNIDSTHLAGLPSKQSSLLSTTSNSTPNKTSMSGSSKKRRLFPQDSDILKEQVNVVNEKCLVSRKRSASCSTVPLRLDKNKPVKQSQQANAEKENSISTNLKISISKKSSRSSKNMKMSSISSSQDGICEAGDVDKPNDADETCAIDKAGDQEEGKCKKDYPEKGKSKKNSEVIIEENSGDSAGGCSLRSPAAAASLVARLPSLDDPGYSTGNDSFNSTMAGSELQFAKITGSKDNNAASTGQYLIARGVVLNGISVYFIQLSKGYLAFRTPLKTVFIGMVGEGYLELLNENKPSLKTQLRPDTEIYADKDAVVALGCQERCPSLVVCMVTMDDRDTNGRTFSNQDMEIRGSV